MAFLDDHADTLEHQVLEGQFVKLAYLFIFKATAVNKPAQNVEKFDLSTNSTAIRLGCRAIGSPLIKNMLEDVHLTYTSLA